MNLPRSQWNKLCRIEGCRLKADARRLCKKHYARWRRHGDPLFTKINMGSVTWEYLLSCCLVNDSTGCIEWQKGTSSGYGKIAYNNKHDRAHRVSYKINIGPIPKGAYVLHRCDNKVCINPDHLFLGSHCSNMQDMSEKGRAKKPNLTSKQILDIKKTKGSYKKKADIHNVSYSTVFRVMNGKTKGSEL